jgi:hypothetical protein
MKTMCILISVFLAPLAGFSQSGPCNLSYTDGKWAITHSDTIAHQCSELHIASLPPLTLSPMPMNLFITAKGTYKLKKAPSLAIPEDYTLLVEDLLTGQYYNLNSPEPYVFNMNRAFNQTRFLLEPSKTPAKLATAGK